MFRNRQLYINGQEVYLDSDEIIPITKQVNNIAELKDRQADFTTDFKIPATRKNRLILESANLLSSNTFVPYVKNSCTYVEDGIELISDGYIVILSHEKGYFNAAAYSGNADFFKLIDKLKLNNLNLPDLNHRYYPNFIYTPEYEKADMKYLFFEPSAQGDLFKSNTLFAYYRPFVSVKRLFKQIIEAQGWTLTGDYDVIDEWMLCPSLKADFSKYNSNAKLIKPFTGYTGFTLFPAWSTEVNDQMNQIIIRSDGCKVKFIRKGKYRIRYTGSFIFSGAERFEFKFGTFDNVISANSNQNIKQNFDIVYEYEVADDNINTEKWVRADLANITSDAIFTMYEFNVSVDLIESIIEPDPLEIIDISATLPNIEQTKFLKSVANQYGLVFETDSQRREVNVWQFNRLIDNIPNADNWSKYVSEDSQVLSYRIGDYAQSNLMKYKETEGTPVGYGDGALIINNQTLETSKELFTLDFSASNDIIKDNKIMALIPLYEKEDTNTYNDKGLKDARVVKMRKINEQHPFIDPPVNYYYLAYFINTAENKGLGFNYRLIEQNYGALSNMLTQSKKLEIKMKIPTIKIQGLKHYIPIYLEQFASYFYINKINQWQKDKLCTVELIKIA